MAWTVHGYPWIIHGDPLFCYEVLLLLLLLLLLLTFAIDMLGRFVLSFLDLFDICGRLMGNFGTNFGTLGSTKVYFKYEFQCVSFEFVGFGDVYM